MAILKRVGFVLLIPFFIIVFIATMIGLAFIVVVQTPAMIGSHYRWKTQLRSQHRFKPRKSKRPSVTTGTLIVDSPTIGWNTRHCWWSPDDILELAPHPIPTSTDRNSHIHETTDKLHLDFDEWCFEKYLSPDTGTAILLTTRNGIDYANRIREQNPKLKIIESWSGPVSEFHFKNAG